MSRKYNYIHQKIVNDDADVLGAIAYSIYKKEKQQFIENFKAKNGKDPEEDDIAKFHEIISTDSNIERFRMQASGILQDFVNSTLSDTIDDIEEACKENHLEQIKKAIEPIKPKTVSVGRQYVRGIVQSVIGAVAFAFLVAVVLFAVSLSNTQYSFTIGGKERRMSGSKKPMREPVCDNCAHMTIMSTGSGNHRHCDLMWLYIPDCEMFPSCDRHVFCKMGLARKGGRI